MSDEHFWRVTQGSHTRYFPSKDDAKQYGDHRFDNYVDGIPFIQPITPAELMVEMNELQAKLDHYDELVRSSKISSN